MKTNVKELVDMMKSKGIGVPELAQKIGVDASTLYRKLGAGGEKFTIGEVHRMISHSAVERGRQPHFFIH